MFCVVFIFCCLLLFFPFFLLLFYSFVVKIKYLNSADNTKPLTTYETFFGQGFRSWQMTIRYLAKYFALFVSLFHSLFSVIHISFCRPTSFSFCSFCFPSSFFVFISCYFFVPFEIIRIDVFYFLFHAFY